jgi:hypothetical protein
MRSLNPPASTHPRPLLVSLVATRLVKDLFGVGISYLSPTQPGKVQDKKVADQAKIRYPKKATLHKDTGFQGYEPTLKRTYQPKKITPAKL